MSYRTFHPVQIGFTPSGHALGSQVVVGRDISSNFEGAGFGMQGRPDFLEKFTINLTKNTNGALSKIGTATFNVQDIETIRASNSNVSTNLTFSFKEVAVCDNGIERRMIILASQVYPKPS